MDRIKELENLILMAKKNYYSISTDDNDKEMSDTEYDLLEDELRKLDPNNKVLKKVGDDLTGITKSKQVIHKIPMLSMEKSHTEEDIIKWYNNKIDSGLIKDDNLCAQPKIDGVAGDAYYINGKLHKISNRGNGTIGMEINKDFISCIPKEIKTKYKLVHIRGEFYIPKTYNGVRDKFDVEPLRNICNGALKRKEKSDIQDEVKFIAYQLIVGDTEDNDIQIATESEKLEIIKSFGNFDVVPYYIIDNIKSAWNYFNEYESSLRNAWNYETDGIILVFNSTDTQNIIVKEFGDTDHHHKYSIAIKPKSAGGWTELIQYEWNTSRTGRVIPVGIIKPLLIGSRMATRATLNNITYIRDRNIQLYDKVYCVMANDVIPKILNSIKTPDSKDIDIENCPSCNTKLIMRGVDYFCPNYLGCSSQRINKFIHWFSNTGIKHIGPSALNNLINAGHVYALWELYAMTREDLAVFIEKFCNIDRTTPTMKEFLDLFEKSKDQTEQEVIGNFGIPSISIKTLEKMKIYDLDDLIKYKDTKYLYSESAVEQKLCQWLNQDDKNFDDLFSLVKFIKPKKLVERKKKKLYCITGNFTNRRRDSLIKQLAELYPKWEFTPTVTKEVELLLVGNETGVSNKSLAAIKYKIPIVIVGETYEEDLIKKHIS